MLEMADMTSLTSQLKYIPLQMTAAKDSSASNFLTLSRNYFDAAAEKNKPIFPFDRLSAVASKCIQKNFSFFFNISLLQFFKNGI